LLGLKSRKPGGVVTNALPHRPRHGQRAVGQGSCRADQQSAGTRRHAGHAATLPGVTNSGHRTDRDTARKKRAFASGLVNVSRICVATLDHVTRFFILLALL